MPINAVKAILITIKADLVKFSLSDQPVAAAVTFFRLSGSGMSIFT